MTRFEPDLSGKAAIVTGASRGIGKALAISLAARGCAVALAAKSETERDGLPGTIHSAAAEVESAGGRALAVRCNVRNTAEIESLVDKTIEAFGRIDYVINNAGALWMKPVLDTPVHRFDLLFAVNLRGPYLLAQMAAAKMVEQGDGGHILNLAPPVDPSQLAGKTPYLITKFGMSMLAHGLAGELSEAGIACNTLWPATAIESQATINHRLGAPENWRKPSILCDALLALLGRPTGSVSGRDLIDEEWLAECGVTDFEPYACVPGGQLLYIHGPKAIW